MNRAGYQVLFMEISSEMIQGYNQEEYTHLGVAAAQALDLDFIPFFKNIAIWSF